MDQKQVEDLQKMNMALKKKVEMLQREWTHACEEITVLRNHRKEASKMMAKFSRIDPQNKQQWDELMGDFRTFKSANSWA